MTGSSLISTDMKAILLARVSTEDQRDAGNSLPAQVERMKAYCGRKGLEIVEIFSFDESAYKTKRDEFDKILDYLEQHKEKMAVVFDKVDRLSRNVFDKRVSFLYEKAVADEIELHFVSDGQVLNSSISATQKFQFSTNLGLAKYYSDAISDNVKRAFEQKRRNGDWIGRPRIGYMNITLDTGKKDIILDPERAHLIKRLFELYATGNYSLTTIWNEITKLGLKSKGGKPLSRSNIEFVLKDPFYYGIAYSKRHGLYPHRYPILFSQELFDKCQYVRQSRGKKRSKLAATHDFLFKGLLTCKYCGCMMTPEIKIKKSGLIFVYYSCTNAKGICKRVYVPEKTLLEPIYADFEAFQKVPKDVQERLVKELRKTNEAEVEYHDKQITRIQAEYKKVQTRLNSLMNLLIDQSITKNDYDKKHQELADEQDRLNIELEEHTKADHDYKLGVSHVFSLARRMKEIFDDPSSEVHEKRAVLNFLLQNPTVSGKKLEYTLRKPFHAIRELANCPIGLRDLDSNQDKRIQSPLSYH